MSGEMQCKALSFRIGSPAWPDRHCIAKARPVRGANLA